MTPRRGGGSSFTESGVAGTAVIGGRVVTGPGDETLRYSGLGRWSDAAQILAEVSIIAASVRYFANLTARPLWKAEPPNDSAPAKEAAEFLESVIYEMDHSWSRTVRRGVSYRYHGFGLHEWTAKNRPDGRIGIAAIEPRPQHTVDRWDVDENLSVTGVWQRAPAGTSRAEVYLPRRKLIYLVDDTLTDSPEGMGWFRHLVDPVDRLRKYLKLEAIGFERDLSGIPVGRAPISSINAAVKAGAITQAEADTMIRGLEDFVRLKSKQPETGIVLDSQPFTTSKDGEKQVSSVMQWGLDLLTGEPNSVEALGGAIRRLTFDMALIMGTQSLLVGREGEGSRALSEDVSRNLYLNINSTLGDMAEAYDRDIVGPVWAMNGLSDDLRPTLRAEDASFKDVEQIARVLRDMSAAGAILAPDDPAIDDVRDLLGVSRQPEIDPDLLGAVRPPPPAPSDPLDPKNKPEDE
jgi:hypothetical protein